MTSETPPFDELARTLVSEFDVVDIDLHYSRSAASPSRRWECFARLPGLRLGESGRAATPSEAVDVVAEKLRARRAVEV